MQEDLIGMIHDAIVGFVFADCARVGPATVEVALWEQRIATQSAQDSIMWLRKGDIEAALFAIERAANFEREWGASIGYMAAARAVRLASWGNS